jgi:hypothetical protein
MRTPAAKLLGVGVGIGCTTKGAWGVSSALCLVDARAAESSIVPRCRAAVCEADHRRRPVITVSTTTTAATATFTAAASINHEANDTTAATTTTAATADLTTVTTPTTAADELLGNLGALSTVNNTWAYYAGIMYVTHARGRSVNGS